MTEEPPQPHSPEPRWEWTYRRSEGAYEPRYDELFDDDGRPRAGWDKLVGPMGALGQSELRRRWDHARQLLREHGVSYDAYGDSKGISRPWNLSAIPVVFQGAEWTRLCEGLGQRARLLAAILADLYGPRRLLESGALPPEIVFANPSFLRPCVGGQPARGTHLPLYAADVGRRPDGSMVVLADRTRAPSGAGYALENRIVLSRALPDFFETCNVERLAVFFRTMRDTLRDLAPQNRDNPRIVLLTPGPYNAAYFEHAFLAQYLGITLVQGPDLTVRDRRVFLKTLGGLQAVDVVLRRVRDDYCDPLELRPDSTLGVAGLVEATRAGTVAMANPLGSALLQSPALMPFLPVLSRQLLGEDLATPSVPTYWCGDQESLRHVEAHLPSLVVRPAFSGGPATAPVFAHALTTEGLEELRTRIRAEPRAFVAQESFVLSTVPTLIAEEIVPGHLWMRAFLVASGDAYEVMPGALSRVGGKEQSLALSLRPGGESKDTWVLSGGPVNTFSLLRPPTAPAVISRGGGDIPSRLADNLYWLGRYAERAEGGARLVRALATRLSDRGGSNGQDGPTDLEALRRVLEARTGGGDVFASVLDPEPSTTLRASIETCYGVARTVRDRVSADTWRTLAQLQQLVHERSIKPGPGSLGALVALLNRIVIALAAFGGLADGSMSRGFAWRFLDMGRRLERAIHMVTILRAALLPKIEAEASLLEALLDIADSSMTYRRRYLATLQVAPVLDLLLSDETNPRSVLFQADALREHLDVLPADATTPWSAHRKLILEAATLLRLADIGAICALDDRGDRPGLAALLDRLTSLFPEVSTSLSNQYMGHTAVSQPVNEPT